MATLLSAVVGDVRVGLVRQKDNKLALVERKCWLCVKKVCSKDRCWAKLKDAIQKNEYAVVSNEYVER